MPTEVTRFRITLWPGTRLPLPPTVRMRSELDPTGKVIVPCLQGAAEQQYLLREDFAPTGQTYLRLLDVDLDDPDAIIAFVNSYGILDGGWAWASGLRELGEYEKALNLKKEWRKIKGALATVSLGDTDRLIPDNHELRFGWTLSEIRTQGSGFQVPTLWHRIAFMETLDEFRFAARCLLDVYWAWCVFNEGLDPSEVEWQSYPGGFPTLGLASKLLTGMLPRLGRIGPQLGVSSGPQAPGPRAVWEPPHETTVGPDTAPRNARLYQACAIELYNHIVEQATYHRCANESCGRLFVHQEGRAHHGQHRKKGVKYCSRACAHAQTQRNYRRRSRATRTQ